MLLWASAWPSRSPDSTARARACALNPSDPTHVVGHRRDDARAARAPRATTIEVAELVGEAAWPARRCARRRFDVTGLPTSAHVRPLSTRASSTPPSARRRGAPRRAWLARCSRLALPRTRSSCPRNRAVGALLVVATPWPCFIVVATARPRCRPTARRPRSSAINASTGGSCPFVRHSSNASSRLRRAAAELPASSDAAAARREELGCRSQLTGQAQVQGDEAGCTRPLVRRRGQ